ncbi:MAG: substrate-binding domain-containing protein [Desmonostoc geniculatum HA4340-LM1]|jgi:ribose transport system substrate-binding protein|nr:substrate-binding domain-containing protein [Desmonostoc geniculatum HA4340-LM1]
MNLRKIAIAASLISLVGGTVIGCSNGSENGTASNPDPNAAGNTATNTSAQSQPGSGDGKLRSVAFTAGDLSNPFFVLMGQEIEATAKKIGGNDVRTTVVSSAYDLNQQANQIENFTASNTDIIILNAADKSGIKPAVEKAKEAGRIVIAVDTGAEGGVDATVTTNNVQAGEVGCQYIADRLKGKGSVVILNGPQVDSVIQRVSGCEKVLARTYALTQNTKYAQFENHIYRRGTALLCPYNAGLCIIKERLIKA